MDFKNLLQSLDQLSEATTDTSTGRVHKAEPGGYGQQHGSEDVKDQYGKPIGRVSLGKLAAQNEPKRGKGRPPNPDKAKSYDSSALSKAMGMGKAPKATGKPSVKHSLKEYFDQLEQALSEGGLTVQPIPAPKQQTGQNFMIKDPSNPQAAAITTSDPAVVDAAKKGTLSMHKPGAAPTSTNATPTTGAGSQVAPMEEDGEKWIKGAIKHPGAFTKKAKAHGMSTSAFASKVLANKDDYPAKTEKQAQLAKTLSKMHEAEAPQNFAQSSPMSAGGRNPNSLEEGKKTVKKDDRAEKDGKKVTKDLEYDMGHKGKDDAKAEKAGKKVTKDIEYDDKKKKKTKVKEGMEHHLQAARLEGKSHALRKMPYSCSHDDMEAARHYHEGFKEGLDECYGQMPILGRTAVGEMGPGSEVATMASYGADDLDEMDKTAYMKQQAIKTPGDTFKAFGQTMRDSDVLDEFAFESLDKQLNAILEGKEVSEGMTVSISKGQQGAPDSVSVSAQDAEADQLLSIIKSAGMGLFGGEDKGFSAPEGSAGAHGGISVVDDHDGMMALMKKLSGGAETSSHDFADEEGHSEEEHSHDDEDSCNECGMAYESCGCDHSDKEVVDEVESEDQMAYEVAEDNPPDNGSANSTNDEQGNAAANQALATADAEENVSEDDTCDKCHSDPCKCDDEKESVTENSEQEKIEFDNWLKKASLKDLWDEASKWESSTPYIGREYEKLVARQKELIGPAAFREKEINDRLKGKLKKYPNITVPMREEGVAEGLTESYANSADDAFEADIDFMMNIISGGLNKRKSTGQTTIPVVASQLNRTVSTDTTDINESVTDWKKLAGI